MHFVTVTTLDRRQLVAGTHGPYKFDIIFMFRQQTKAYPLPILHFTLCISPRGALPIFNFPFSIQKALPDGKPSGSAFLYLRISN